MPACRQAPCSTHADFIEATDHEAGTFRWDQVATSFQAESQTRPGGLGPLDRRDQEPRLEKLPY